MLDDILRLLSENARLSDSEIAERLNSSAEDVKKHREDLEKRGLIKGYRAIIEESALPESKVKAVIEVKVTPQREGGFDKIARRLSKFSEVSSVYLMSGGYDLELVVQGNTLHDVAYFVSNKLSTMEGVTSTSTHFLLKKYKELGELLEDSEEYERLKVTP